MADAVAVGLAQQRLDRRLAAMGQGDVQLGVARVFTQGLFQTRDPGFVLPLLHQFCAVFTYRTGATACDGHAQRQKQERSRLAQL
ncbi:hypothetical protein D3C76_1101320 [compost metagenome]